LNWLDLVSILPYFVTLIIEANMENERIVGEDVKNGLAYVSGLRMLRVTRIFKILRRFQSTQILGFAAYRSIRPLAVPLFFLMVMVLVGGVVLAMAEPCFTDSCQFQDVFNSMYFILVTICTVGYGDQIPITWSGRFVAAIMMIFGSFFMAMPLAIIGHNFEEVWESFQKEKRKAAALTRAERGVAIEIKPLGAQTKNETKAGFLKHYFDLVLSGNEIRCLMQANGTAQYQKAMEEQEQVELKRIGGGGENAKHQLLLESMLRFHAAYHIVRQDAINLTRDTPLREKISLANRRFITMKMTSHMHSKIRSMRQHLNEKRKCRAVIFRTMENPDTSMSAWIIHKVLIVSVLCSILLFAMQSMTDLNQYGPNTSACQFQFKQYCGIPGSQKDRWDDARDRLSDPACFKHDVKIGKEWHHYGYKNCSDEVMEILEKESGIVDVNRRQYGFDFTAAELQKCKAQKIIGEIRIDDASGNTNGWSTEQRETDKDVVPPGGVVHRFYDFPIQSGVHSPFCFSCGEKCKGDIYHRPGTNKTQDVAKSFKPLNIDKDQLILPKESTTSDTMIRSGKKNGSYVRSYGFRYHDDRDTTDYEITWYNLDKAEQKDTVHRSRTAYDEFPRIYPICERPQCIKNDWKETEDNYRRHKSMNYNMSPYWLYLELAFNIFFTIELLIKLVVYPDLSQWFLGPDALVNFVDVIAVLPFWIELLMSAKSYGYIYTEPLAGEVSPVKILRMLAVLRVFKLVRNFDGATVIVQTIKSAWSRLILPFFYLIVFVVVFGCMVYTFENTESAGADQPFPEMLTACWFVLVTMTTTGYGKVVPTMMPTKMLAIVIMIAGNFYMAMPLTIVGSTFWGHYAALIEKEETLQKAKEAMKAARRNTIRAQKQVEAARVSRRRSMKKMSKNEIKQKMMSPVQETAFHQLFAMASNIEELLGKIRNCPAKDDDSKFVSLFFSFLLFFMFFFLDLIF
jgi:hypothetical protein